MDVNEKNYLAKALAQDVFDRRWRPLHWSNDIYQCEIFNFVDLCSGV